MKVLLTGLNHRTAPVEVREQLAFDPHGLHSALDHLRSTPGVNEAMILSTCNRVEITVTGEDQEGLLAQVVATVARERGVDPDWLRNYLYTFEDNDAIRHLFRVAASLDSMVLGEPQILGQMKSAFHEAKTHGAVNGFLESVLTRAFSVAKRVRSETEIGRNAVSVSYAAIELARQVFGNLSRTRVLLIGAGKMSELAARHLRRAGCAAILVTNRTRSRADEMAALVDGTVIEYESFRERLADIDIIIASSGATDYVLRTEEVSRALERRRNSPIFLIDIAVPRNIEPTVNALEHVFLYDIDDLGRAVQENRVARRKEADAAELIIDDEIRRLGDRLKARSVAPLIVELQHSLDATARHELERLRARFGSLTPQQEEALQAYTRSLLNKIAHAPIAELRRAAAQQDNERVVDVIRRIFRLEGPGG